MYDYVYHTGYPVLWAISDKEDEPAMQVIFNSVKKRCPNGEINVLMTDDCKDVVYLIMIKYVVCISHSIVWIKCL